MQIFHRDFTRICKYDTILSDMYSSIPRRDFMSTVIAFLGSPRKNGASTQLVIKAIEGAKAAGAEVVIYDMNDDEIKGCQCCYYCRAHEGCATKDKLQPMYEQIKEADGIIASFPIFFHNINSQGKKLIGFFQSTGMFAFHSTNTTNA